MAAGTAVVMSLVVARSPVIIAVAHHRAPQLTLSLHSVTVSVSVPMALLPEIG